MSTDFDNYFKHYLDLVSGMEPLAALTTTHGEFMLALAGVDDEKGLYRYEENKWTVKEVLVHILDVERIFAYRALRFARNDKTPLAGFDDMDYARASLANNRQVSDLVSEFDLQRKSTFALLSGFDKSVWEHTGVANGIEFSVKSLALLIAGHGRHHLGILQERYGI